MMGYTYQDVQEFGNGLTWAIDNAPDESIRRSLLDTWDFFEGLLAEGHIG